MFRTATAKDCTFIRKSPDVFQKKYVLLLIVEGTFCLKSTFKQHNKYIRFLAVYLYSGLWHLDETLFEDTCLHTKHIDNLKNEFTMSGETFAKDFRKKHSTESSDPKVWVSSDNPDAWLIFEVATFGTLSKFYKNIKHQLPQKSIIANEFGLNLHNELSSWLEAISYLRNIVAHHSRVWSRNIVKRITLPKSTRNLWLSPATILMQEKERFPKPFLTITAMIYLCNAIDPNNNIKKKLIDLFNCNPNISILKLGFFNNWQNEPLWK